MKGILLPGNSLNFPLVKVIVRKIAYKGLTTTKNVRFLRMDHRNVVHENFFRGLGDIICIKNLFKPIKVINRTNFWAISTRINQDIDHFSKRHAPPPEKLPFVETYDWFTNTFSNMMLKKVIWYLWKKTFLVVQLKVYFI